MKKLRLAVLIPLFFVSSHTYADVMHLNTDFCLKRWEASLGQSIVDESLTNRVQHADAQCALAGLLKKMNIPFASVLASSIGYSKERLMDRNVSYGDLAFSYTMPNKDNMSVLHFGMAGDGSYFNLSYIVRF